MKTNPKNYPGALVETSQLFKIFNKPYQQLEDIHNSIDDVIWAATFEPYQCLYLNKAAEKVFGYSVQELLDDPVIFPACIYPEDKEQFYASITLAFETGKSSCVFRIKHKDGRIKVLKAQAILKKASEGKKPVLTGIASDITALLNIRNQLKDKAEELETILESINDVFFTLDHNANITYVNNALERILDVNRKALLGKNAWEMFPASKNTRFYETFSACLQNKETARFEDYYEPVGKWFSLNIYPTKNGLSVFGTDITEQKKAKEDIISAKRNLRALIDNTSNLIWSIDRDMNIIESNAAYKKTLLKRYGSRPAKGKSVFDNIPEKQREEWYGYFKRALAGETYTLLHKKKFEEKIFYSRVSFNPMFDNKYDVVGVSCFSSDITAQYEQRSQIEKKNELLAEIATQQSHQVRGPVASILGLSQLLNADNPDDPANAEVIKGFIQSAKDLEAAIREIDSITRKNIVMV